MSLTVRPATAADLAAVNAVYNHYVHASTCTFALEPTPDEERRAWFAGRSVAHPVTVAELAGGVVGWGSLSPWNSRCGYARTAEVSFYVRHDCHRRGVGRALLADLVDRARAAGHHALIGGACTEIEASTGLMAAFGFEKVAHFREVGFKFGRWLDVAYYQLLL